MEKFSRKFGDFLSFFSEFSFFISFFSQKFLKGPNFHKKYFDQAVRSFFSVNVIKFPSKQFGGSWITCYFQIWWFSFFFSPKFPKIPERTKSKKNNCSVLKSNGWKTSVPSFMGIWLILRILGGGVAATPLRPVKA